MAETELLQIALRIRADLDSLLKHLHPRRHSPDFCSVFWEGQPYSFTRAQARVVKTLWKAMENLTPEVSQEELLESVIGPDSDEDGCARLRDLFRRSPAWGTLIVDGETKGSYRLRQ